MLRGKKLNTAEKVEATSKMMLSAATLVEKTMRKKVSVFWGDSLTITLKFKINKKNEN